MIAESCPSNIDVYGQAVLRLNELESEHKLKLKAKKVIFPISGELKGFIVCETEVGVNFSLFVESMNILLGQLLTNLADQTYIFAQLEAPLLTQPNLASIHFDISTNINYKLYTLCKTYDCKVSFKANKIKAKEV